MNNTTLSRIATISLLLGTSTVACTPGGQRAHVAAASDGAPDGAARNDADATRYATRARAALADHKGAEAVKFAEKAVAASPNDADCRMLLGQAYMGDGRFASAETSFRDTLALAPDQSRAGFDLALAQIAQGQGVQARATLARLGGKLSASDLGLALTLSGDHEAGIAMLIDLVRSGKSDARARQNLALSFALDGRWREARGVAMQDTPPDRINDQIAGWAELASPSRAAQQVASVLGVTPALADPGLPTQLALAAPTRDAPVALALAAPAPAAPVVAPVMQPAAVRTVSLPLEAPSAPTPAVVPALLAAAPAPVTAEAPVVAEAAPPPLIRAAAAPVRVAARSVAPGQVLDAHASGGFVVQLGAYARAGAIDTAWAEASRLSPRVATFSPVRGSTTVSGATLVRLSIGNFASHDEAAAVCTQIKARGGACFVRGTGNDAPLQWVRKDGDRKVQVAMRKSLRVSV